MKITESKLREMVRNVLKEGSYEILTVGDLIKALSSYDTSLDVHVIDDGVMQLIGIKEIKYSDGRISIGIKTA